MKLYLSYESVKDIYEDSFRDRITSTSYTFKDLHTEKPNGWIEYQTYPVDFDVKIGDILFVVIAVWTTGDTFSRDEGYGMDIMGIYKDSALALEAKKRIDKSGELDAEPKLELPDGPTLTGYAIPWNGYFESFNYSEILTRMVVL